ncbi:unnamed protein product [Mytilus edulis]|uniref:Uncharacterized protein n=1 Tax=Mytilus edulis TaxID=6550 RepID=A0A8S3TMB6_MYTED|nr:unnamed protein product [Mytilus edulis]
MSEIEKRTKKAEMNATYLSERNNALKNQNIDLQKRVTKLINKSKRQEIGNLKIKLKLKNKNKRKMEEKSTQCNTIKKELDNLRSELDLAIDENNNYRSATEPKVNNILNEATDNTAESFKCSVHPLLQFSDVCKQEIVDIEKELKIKGFLFHRKPY